MSDPDALETQNLTVTSSLATAPILVSQPADEEALRQAEQAVALEWRPGEVILDLYEVRRVVEGFGEDAEEKDYHLGGFGRVYRVWHKGWRRDMAVKTPRPGAFATVKQKKAFVRECETWVNLGLHPHIAACHYVRELGGTPRVFSEYADAGTLSQWIRTEHLYEGGKEQALARILDAAIQFAWGLQYAHDCGVIHQDVKPLNALMWKDGSLKVTDFGLAGARQIAVGEPEQMDGATDDATLLHTHGAMTPAYCSPEQAAGKTLMLQTDLWSWAVSLFEMFQGEVTWQSGSLADAAFARFLEHNGEDAHIPAMPDGVIALLGHCFKKAPSERPLHMKDCAHALIEAYTAVTGEDYPRREPLAARDTPDALSNRALSFLDLGKAAEAQRLFEQALQKDYHNLAATYNGGLLKWRMGVIDDREARTSLEAVQNDYPSAWRVRWALGQLDKERGDFRSALKHFEKALFLGNNAALVVALNEVEEQARVAAGFERVYEDHTAPVNAVRLSPDGKTALSAAGHDVVLREIPSGGIVRTLKGHGMSVASLDFSPDGNFFLSGSHDDTMKLWDTNTGECLRSFDGHESSVYTVAFSPDGRFALSGSEDRTLRLWEVASGRCLRIFSGHAAAVRSVAFSPHGLFVLSGAGNYGADSEDNTLKLWDANTGAQLRTFIGHEAYLTAVCFSPDSRHILSGGNDGTLRLWDLTAGECLRVFRGHEGGVWSAAYSPDGRRVLSGDNQKSIRQWEVATGRCLRTFEGHNASVSSVCYSHDGALAYSGSWDHSTRLWYAGDGLIAPNLYTVAVEVNTALERQHGHEAALKNAKNSLATGDVAAAIVYVAQARAIPGFERTAEALDVCRRIGTHAHIRGYRGAWLSRIYAEHTGAVLAMAVSPTGTTIASGGRDHTVRLWRLGTGVCEKRLEGHTREVNAVLFSPDGRQLLSGGGDGAIRLWSAETGAFIHLFQGQKSPIHCLTFSADGQFALSGDAEALIKVWHVPTGKCKRVCEGHKSNVTAVRLAPGNRFAISCSTDHTVKLWDMRHGRCYRTLEEHQGIVEEVCLSKDGKSAFTGGWDKKALLWDTETGRCLRVFEGHTGNVNCVALSPDERYLLSGAGTFVGLKKDDTIRLWEIGTGRCLRAFEGHDDAVLAVAFAQNGRFFVSASDDGTLMLWEIDWEYEC